MFSRLPLAVLKDAQIESLLVNIVNDSADKTFNLSAVVGFLQIPGEMERRVNLTQMHVGEALEPSKELTIDYRFVVPTVPEPLVVALKVYVFYEDTRGLKKKFVDECFNATLTIVPSPRPVDSTAIAAYILAVVAIVAGALIIRAVLQKSAKKRKAAAAAVPAVDNLEEELSVAAVPTSGKKGAAKQGAAKQRAARAPASPRDQ